MNTSGTDKIVLLGAGNVATHLGKALRNAGLDILQVYSRSEKSASGLAALLNCGYTTKYGDIDSEAGLYVIAVTDDAIGELAKVFPHKGKLVVHTSGSTDMDVLAPASDRRGVIYPLQTFSRDVEVDFSSVPICLEASKDADRENLSALASRLSDRYEWISGEQRRVLHISAVFACNFVNHMYTVSSDLLNRNGLGFDLMVPLIIETARKASQGDPSKMQTGPAIRDNRKIMDRHIESLSADPDYKRMYEIISESIRRMHNKDKSI